MLLQTIVIAFVQCNWFSCLMVSKEYDLRLRVYNFYKKNADLGHSFTVRHFEAEGHSRRTIYGILQRLSNGTAAERKPGSGRKASIFTPKKIASLKRTFENNDSISYRIAAKQFNASPSFVHKTLATKTKIRYRKKKSIPARTDKQIKLAKIKCGRLIRKFSGRSFILDDESYFTLSHSTKNFNSGFYSSNVNATSADIKFSKKQKFPSRVLVWIALGPKGLSKPLIRKSGFIINANNYLDECIRHRLIRYIRTNYGEDEF